MALKIHPVHAGVAANDRMLYPAYEACQAAGVPVVVHCGTSTFPGAANTFGDPVVLDDVLRDFRSLTLVLAHGGRGWWYDAAAFLALSSDRVWIELSGLPPSRLRDYYARQNWARLTRRMIFGTDWPGIPGIAANARAVARLMPDEDTAAQVLAGNATRVYNLKTARREDPQFRVHRQVEQLRRHQHRRAGDRRQVDRVARPRVDHRPAPQRHLRVEDLAVGPGDAHRPDRRPGRRDQRRHELVGHRPGELLPLQAERERGRLRVPDPDEQPPRVPVGRRREHDREPLAPLRVVAPGARRRRRS